MSADIENLKTLLQTIIDAGAQLCVLADELGLPIIVQSPHGESELTTSLSALSSVIKSMGDTCAQELNGEFLDAIVHTSKGTMLAFSIPSSPPLVLMAIADETYTNAVQHHLKKIRKVIAASMEGIAMELPRKYIETPSNQTKIEAFFGALRDQVSYADSPRKIAQDLSLAKEDLIDVLGRWSRVGYEMNRLAASIKRRDETEIEDVRKEVLKYIHEWENRLKNQR